MFRLLITVPCLFVLLSCATEGDRRRAEYLDASYLQRLELPPDLIYEESNLDKSQLKLPKPTEKATRAFKEGLEESERRQKEK